MSRKFGNSAVFFVIRRTVEAPFSSRKEVLQKSLFQVKDSLTDSEIWEIIDFFSSRGIKNQSVIKAVISSGAQSAESTLRMLRVFRYQENLCKIALETYGESAHFRENIFSATESNPLLQRRLINHSIDHIIEQVC